MNKADEWGVWDAMDEEEMREWLVEQGEDEEELEGKSVEELETAMEVVMSFELPDGAEFVWREDGRWEIGPNEEACPEGYDEGAWAVWCEEMAQEWDVDEVQSKFIELYRGSYWTYEEIGEMEGDEYFDIPDRLRPYINFTLMGEDFVNDYEMHKDGAGKMHLFDMV
jgi:hypothetical protein